MPPEWEFYCEKCERTITVHQAVQDESKAKGMHEYFIHYRKGE